MTAELAALRARVAELEAILVELAELKIHKDAFGKTEDYQRRQPLAWKRVRQAVNAAVTPTPDPRDARIAELEGEVAALSKSAAPAAVANRAGRDIADECRRLQTFHAAKGHYLATQWALRDAAAEITRSRAEAAELRKGAVPMVIKGEDINQAMVEQLEACRKDLDLLMEANSTMAARIAELEAESQTLHGRIVEGDYAGLKRVAELEAALREIRSKSGDQWSIDTADRALGDDHG